MMYQFKLGIREKIRWNHGKIRESETDLSPCTWLLSDCAIEANDAEKLRRVPIQKEVLPRGRNDFLSSAVFWNRCPRITNQDVIYSPIFQVKLSYFLLYFRSNLLYFSYIPGLNLLYFRPSPIFFGSLVAWHPGIRAFFSLRHAFWLQVIDFYVCWTYRLFESQLLYTLGRIAQSVVYRLHVPKVVGSILDSARKYFSLRKCKK